MAIEETHAFEPVIGRGVTVEVHEKSDLRKSLESIAEEEGLTLSERGPRVTIRVSDVDWEKSNEITIRYNTLRKIVDTIGEDDES